MHRRARRGAPGLVVLPRSRELPAHGRRPDPLARRSLPRRSVVGGTRRSVMHKAGGGDYGGGGYSSSGGATGSGSYGSGKGTGGKGSSTGGGSTGGSGSSSGSSTSG